MKAIQYLKENYWLIAILFLGAFLRFYKLDFQSVWLDEIHTLNEANPNLSFSEVYNSIMVCEQMPPLYFYSVYFLFKIFGFTPFVVRFYSAIIGVISLYAIYALGKELTDKKTGMIASLLLSLNIFHLYYSQEARPYGFLTLFTILAFYRLIKYIKSPNLKNSILYGLFAGLMLLSHFFGLFVLLAQAFIILVFLILSEKKKRTTFFVSSAISAIVALVLFIPAIKIFLKVSEIKEFWIPPTDLNTIKQIFKDFCGNSDFILILAFVGLVYYCVLLIRDKNPKKGYNAVVENKLLFSSIILVSWIIIVLAIPIARSYLVIPMIVSRYFIVILPAFILAISIAISNCNNTIAKTTFLTLLACGMFYETAIHSNYYTNVSKAQFRETSQFITDNNSDKEPIVSSLAWYLGYFFKNGDKNFEVVDKPLDNYISEMQQDSTKIKSFWYMDAHGREFKPNEQTKTFLDKIFYVENNFDGFQAWTKHFVLLKYRSGNVDISKFKNIEKINGDDFRYYIEKYEYANNNLNVTGWAYFDGQESNTTTISLVLIKDGMANRLPSQKVTRPDVTSYFKSNFDISNSGYTLSTDISNLSKGKYTLGIYLLNRKTNKEGLILTDKVIVKD